MRRRLAPERMSAMKPEPRARFEWGQLKDHWSQCPIDAEEEGGCGGSDDPCAECGGEGRVRWGSFYEEDRGTCDVCRRRRPIQEGDAHEWTCVECYIRQHNADCGCDLWPAAL